MAVWLHRARFLCLITPWLSFLGCCLWHQVPGQAAGFYREAYYNKESQRPNISECIVAKNRHGETGTVELVWDGQYTRFSNPDYSEAPGDAQ